MSSPMVSAGLAKTFIVINSASRTCDLMPMRWAKSRTITGGFICTTLLPLSSTINAGCAGAAGAWVVGRWAGTGGATGRCAVVIFTVGCGAETGLGGAGAGAGFGATTGAGAAAGAWDTGGVTTDFSGASCGVSVAAFGTSAPGAGAGMVATTAAPSFFSATTAAGVAAGETGTVASGAGGGGGGGATYPYSLSIDSAVILSTVLEWLFTG